MVKTAKEERDCLCGCETRTTGTFAPGHDNRFYGQVRRGERPESDLAPFPGLMRKLAGAQKRDDLQAERKAERAAAEDGDGAVEEAGSDLGSEVKIGRWTYPVVRAEVIADGEKAGRVMVTYRRKDGKERTNDVPMEWIS